MPQVNDPTTGFALGALPQPFEVPQNIGKFDVGQTQAAYANSLKNLQSTALVGPETQAAISQAKYQQAKNQQLMNLLDPEEQTALATFRAQKLNAQNQALGLQAQQPYIGQTSALEAQAKQRLAGLAANNPYGLPLFNYNLGGVEVPMIGNPQGGASPLGGPNYWYNQQRLDIQREALANQERNRTIDHYIYTRTGRVQQGDQVFDLYDKQAVNQNGVPLAGVAKVQRPYDEKAPEIYTELPPAGYGSARPAHGGANLQQATNSEQPPTNEAPLTEEVQTPSGGPTTEEQANPENNIPATEEPEAQQGNVQPSAKFVIPTIAVPPTPQSLASWKRANANVPSTPASAISKSVSSESATPAKSQAPEVSDITKLSIGDNTSPKLTDPSDPKYIASKALIPLILPKGVKPDPKIAESISRQSPALIDARSKLDTSIASIENAKKALSDDAAAGLIKPGFMNTFISPKFQAALGNPTAQNAAGALNTLLSDTAGDYGGKYRNFGVVTQLLQPAKPDIKENMLTSANKLQLVSYLKSLQNDKLSIQQASNSLNINPAKTDNAIDQAYGLSEDRFAKGFEKYKKDHPYIVNGIDTDQAYKGFLWSQTPAAQKAKGTKEYELLKSDLAQFGISI